MEAIRRRRNEATLAGQTGTGKSHMAQAFGHCAARQGHNVLFISQTELFKRLNAARATGCYDRKFQQLAWVPLLIVIDFALSHCVCPSTRTCTFLSRPAPRSLTILTSNLDLEEWGAAFSDNRVLGVATLDPLRHGAYRLVFEGTSRRDPKPMPEPPENPVAKTGKNRNLETVRIRVLLPFLLASLRRPSTM
ncbi:DNA replication protein DnaC [Paraburkholderia sp. GAS448]|uniref:ATP-binding protein n=1 Tax=Paraburkholderia sp. GAS448 TaxID=3035136 RepID=UPI003D263E8B